VDPPTGAVPGHGFQDVSVLLDAEGLDDMDHYGVITVSSNDPQDGVQDVQLLLHVGEVELDYLDIDPNTLNLGSNGNTVRAAIQLPPQYDVHDVDVSTVSVFGTLFANPQPVSFADTNGDGIEEILLKFDRTAFRAQAPVGAEALVTVTGEVRDTVWFTGTTTITAIHPEVVHPNGGEYFTAGQPVFISWQEPDLAPGSDYDVYLSLDGGDSWEPVGSTQGVTGLEWTVPSASTDQARVRVHARDGLLVLGYDESDEAFTISSALAPPGPVTDLVLAPAEGGTLLRWKRPLADAAHGPVETYQVLVASHPEGPFQQVAEVVSESYLDPTPPPSTSVLYYRIVATNPAGHGVGS
jgi:hypothetical protein